MNLFACRINSTSPPHSHVTGITEDSAGWLWLSTLGSGVCRFDPRPAWCVLYDHATVKDVGFFGRVSAIEQAPGKNVWIACSKGIVEWHSQEDRFIGYLKVPADFGRMFENAVRTIVAPGSEDKLWIGGENGLIDYDLASQTARRLGSIPDNVETSVMANGRLWIGTTTGLRSLDIATQKVMDFPSNAKLSTAIYALCADGNDGLWIGTQNDGLVHLQIETGSTRGFTSTGETRGSLPSNSIRSLHVDSRARVWAGTLRGLCRKEEASDQWIFYDNEAARREIRTIGEDSAGNLWLGTDSGIVRMSDVGAEAPTFHFYQELHGARIGSVQGYCKVNDNLQLFGGHHGVYLSSAWAEMSTSL